MEDGLAAACPLQTDTAADPLQRIADEVRSGREVKLLRAAKVIEIRVGAIFVQRFLDGGGIVGGVIGRRAEFRIGDIDTEIRR